jgi:hypothetical protein
VSELERKMSGGKGPARGYSWKTFEKGNEANRRHGAYGVRLAPRAEELAAGIRELVPASTDSDEPTIRLLAMVLARIEAAHVWMSEQDFGIFRNDGGELQPVLRALSTWENTAARLLDRLGCTPTSRAALGLDIARSGDALAHYLAEQRSPAGESPDVAALAERSADGEDRESGGA